MSLRFVTLERRIDGIETAMRVLTQRLTAMQAQIDYNASKMRL